MINTKIIKNLNGFQTFYSKDLPSPPTKQIIIVYLLVVTVGVVSVLNFPTPSPCCVCNIGSP